MAERIAEGVIAGLFVGVGLAGLFILAFLVIFIKSSWDNWK